MLSIVGMIHAKSIELFLIGKAALFIAKTRAKEDQFWKTYSQIVTGMSRTNLIQKFKLFDEVNNIIYIIF